MPSVWLWIKWRSVGANGIRTICTVWILTMGELLIGLTKYFALYDAERLNQALGNQTPDSVHTSSTGGGAKIVGKYGVPNLSPRDSLLRFAAQRLRSGKSG